MFQPCDVADEVQCEALVQATVAAFGRIINIASQAANPGFPHMAGDTAAACAWLASADAVHVTGEALNVRGREEMH
jgi:NAD(P)-dependent dehydrogenase (short-subunit alcohol dehydrogenase family)